MLLYSYSCIYYISLITLYFNYFNASYTKYGYLNLILCFNTIYRL